ncbi:uncharacterized protein LOC144640704 [Oculina patagonica]
MEDRSKLAAIAFKDSATYQQVRPTYPVESVKFLLKKLGILENQRLQPLNILELGSGTGKFTRVMMEVLEGIDARVIASDPTDTMIQQFQKMLPNVEVLQFHAEKIILPDSSVDAVVAAHCFHWFANQDAVREIYRVLAPGGTLGMIWTIPDESVPWVKDFAAFFRPLEKDFKYTISKETMGKVFEEVGKLFTVEKDSSIRISWPVSYDGCYKYFASKGIMQSSSDEIKQQFETWFHSVMKKHFPERKESDTPIFPLVALICWCTKINES